MHHIKKIREIKDYSNLEQEINSKQLTNSFFHADSIINLENLGSQRISRLAKLTDYCSEKRKNLKKFIKKNYPYDEINEHHYIIDDKIFFPNDVSLLNACVDDICNPKYPHELGAKIEAEN